jgi:quercetin dioxygenase-like cupin family protein
MGCGVTQFMHENKVKMQPDVLKDVSADFIGAGLLAKRIPLKAYQVIIKHKHDYDHLSLLLDGVVIVETDEGAQTLVAPSSIVIKAGLYHKLTALTDSLWLCIHACTPDQIQGL